MVDHKTFDTLRDLIISFGESGPSGFNAECPEKKALRYSEKGKCEIVQIIHKKDKFKTDVMRTNYSGKLFEDEDFLEKLEDILQSEQDMKIFVTNKLQEKERLR